MKHIMKLNANAFDRMAKGLKTREYRLYDEKRQLLQLGDIIEFQKLPELDKNIEVEIIGLLRYGNFYDMYSDFFDQDFADRYKSVEEVVDGTYDKFYSMEEEKKYGCLAIKIRLLSDFLKELRNILEQNRDKRIVVVGTTCTGKSTIINSLGYGLDMDKIIFPLLTKEETDYVCQVPWTEEIGNYMDRLVKEKIQIQSGNPVFGTVVIDSDLIIHLDIPDDLLLERTKRRGVNFDDAKNMGDKIRNEVESSTIPYLKVKVR